MSFKQKSFVERDLDVINIFRLNRSKVVSDFISVIKDGKKKGFDNFLINLSHLDGIFPNATVPIAGLLDRYKKEGLEFEYEKMPSNLSKTQMTNPQHYSKGTPNILNRVWKFTDHSEVGLIVDAYDAELRREDRFNEGTIKTITWSLNEVMDNVLIHSESDCGYVMGQIHKQSKNIAFTVYDSGQGIYNSLRCSQFPIHNALDAITMAVKEEVTRDRSLGQGNGLFGLHSIVKQGKGSLEIISGGASYRYSNYQTTNYQKLPMPSIDRPGTTVDFQLNYGTDISLSKALVFRGKEYPITDLYVESFEDEHGNNYFSVKEHAEGTGTREAAIRLKNEIMNLFTETHKPIILDFKDVALMSSSYADELIAKLLLELGLFQFNNVIKMKGLDIQQQNILQRSVIQRLVDTLNEPVEIKQKTL